MTLTTLAQSRSFEVPQRSGFALRLSIPLWNIMLIGLIAVLGAWYLIEVNAAMDKGYRIRDANSRLSALQAQARSNEVKLTEMETVSNLTSQATALGMVPVGSVEYVNRTTGMALR